MSTIFDALVDLICLPYYLWKSSIENSRVGPSESELETLRFWKWVAIIGTGILVAVGGGIALLFGFFGT